MDKLKKILIAVILIIIGFFVVYGVLNILSKNTTPNELSENGDEKDNANIENGGEKNKSLNFIYSFSLDDDNDGLSNAKEIIYGSNPSTQDTDSDSYLDGSEVEFGYDPVVAGSTRIDDREDLSLTIKYFNWVKEKYGVRDPILLDSSINEYLDLNFPDPLDTPEVEEEELIITENETEAALQKYVDAINKIEFPAGFSSYSELYEKALAGEKININSVIDELNNNTKKLYFMEVPESALYIHEEYIGIMETLKNIFADLEYAQEDPVKIKLNMRIGKELAAIANDLEEEKIDLLADFEEDGGDL